MEIDICNTRKAVKRDSRLSTLINVVRSLQNEHGRKCEQVWNNEDRNLKYIDVM
jgi:hypothetical protein